MNKGIVLKDVSRRYGNDVALRHVSLALPKKGLFGIVGHSGSGKSTLLNILSGLDTEYEGSACFQGKEWKKQGVEKRCRIRLLHIGYVFQNFRLLELEDVLSNVKMPIDALYETNEKDKRQKAIDLIRFVGLEKKLDQRVNTLSGGEKQRIALARALANDPDVLLADEPTGALDERNAKLVFDLLKGVAKKTLVVVVSHDRALIEEYCERIIVLKDGKISEKIEKICDENKAKIPKSIALGKKKKNPSLRCGFMFRHAWHLLKAKKLRSLISEGTIALGLGALGVSVYISSSIQSEITAAFSSIVPTSTIIMGKSNGEGASIGDIYSATIDDAEYFVDAYPDAVEDYGTCLLLDYETWFCDDNYFSYNAGANVMTLSGFSMRQINDFLWYTPGQGDFIYPRHVINMGNDEVILGLPYAAMANICLSLHIQRSYQSLGDYISEKGFPIILHASHIEWGFEDEELFSVVGVKESSAPCFFHANRRWNRSVILDTMYFRSSLREETPSPQYIQEIPYISLSCPVSEFMALVRYDDEMDRMIFERASSYYHPSVCVSGYSCQLNRLFLYSADKGGVSFRELDDIMKKHPDIIGRNIVSSGGYFAEPDSFVSGFQGKFLVSPSKEQLLEVSDAYSVLPTNMAMASLPLGEQVKDACVLSSGDNLIRLGVAAKQKYISGRMPMGLEECAISSSLAKKWDNLERLHFAMEVGADTVGEVYERDFRFGEMKVTGVVDYSFDAIYLISDWTYDGPIELCGMSPFLLEPSGAIFYIKEGVDSRVLVDALAKENPAYRFFDPSLEISTSLEDTMNYIQIVLDVFSFVGIGVSLMLFIIVISITISENGHETGLFYVVGITPNNLVGVYFSHAVIYSLFGLASSWLLIFGAEILVKLYLGQLFGTPFQWTFSFAPFLATLLLAGSFLLVVYLVLYLKMLRKRTF